MPVKVRAVAVPATVIPVPAFPLITPFETESVTVISPLATSTSANGVPVNSRLLAASSITVKETGAVTVGASLASVITKLKV